MAHRAPRLGVDELPDGIVQRHERGIAQVEQRDVRLAPGRDAADLIGEPERLGTADRRRGECLLPALAGEQREQLHRLEHVLRIGTTGVIGAQRELRASIDVGAHWRHAASRFQIGRWIQRHVRPGTRHLLDLVRLQPDAVRQRKALVQQPHAREMADERAAVRAEVIACDRRIALGFVHVAEHSQTFPLGQLGEQAEKLL